MAENSTKQEFVKECIYEAILKLMAIKDFNDITVTELAQRAGVSRMAFYRNYNIVQDVIIDHLDATMLGLENFVNDNSSSSLLTTHDVWLFISSSLTFFRDNSVLMQNLVRSRMSYILINWMEDNFRGKLSGIIRSLGLVTEYDLAAFIGMFYEISMVYIKGNMDDDSTVIAASAMYRVIYNFLKNSSRASAHFNAPMYICPLAKFNALGNFMDDKTKEYAMIYMLVQDDRIVDVGGECSDNSVLRACVSAALSLVIQKATLSALTLTLDEISAVLDGLDQKDLYCAAIVCAAVKNAGIDHYNRRNLARSYKGTESLNYELNWTINENPIGCL